MSNNIQIKDVSNDDNPKCPFGALCRGSCGYQRHDIDVRIQCHNNCNRMIGRKIDVCDECKKQDARKFIMIADRLTNFLNATG